MILRTRPECQRHEERAEDFSVVVADRTSGVARAASHNVRHRTNPSDILEVSLPPHVDVLDGDRSIARQVRLASIQVEVWS